jgi:hypothetical protein
MTTTIKYCMITVRRQDGTVEVVRHPKITYMTPKLWSEFQAAMRKAGRGEGISYENIEEEVPLTLEEQRQRLTWNLEAAIDRYQDAMQRAHASSVGGMDLVKYQQAAKEAKATLDAFDAAHPEIISAIKTKRAENAERNIWG